MVAQERINVKQWEYKTTKLNFFWKYFVRKNSEKQGTQALTIYILEENN